MKYLLILILLLPGCAMTKEQSKGVESFLTGVIGVANGVANVQTYRRNRSQQKATTTLIRQENDRRNAILNMISK